MKVRLGMKQHELEQVEANLEGARKLLQDAQRQKEDLVAQLELVRNQLVQETNINDDIVKA
jgi:hypothetical protein